MIIEISQASSQFPYLQIKGSYSNHKEPDFQGLSNLQLEHQEDLPSPYEYVVSNYDKELDTCVEARKFAGSNSKGFSPINVPN